MGCDWEGGEWSATSRAWGPDRLWILRELGGEVFRSGVGEVMWAKIARQGQLGAATVLANLANDVPDM